MTQPTCESRTNLPCCWVQTQELAQTTPPLTSQTQVGEAAS